MAESEKPREMSREKAADCSAKLMERSDGHWAKAVLFLALGIALKVWNFDLAESVTFLKVTAENKVALTGILACVGLYHAFQAALIGRQGIKLGGFADWEFRRSVAVINWGWPSIAYLGLGVFAILTVLALGGELLGVLDAIYARAKVLWGA